MPKLASGCNIRPISIAVGRPRCSILRKLPFSLNTDVGSDENWAAHFFRCTKSRATILTDATNTITTTRHNSRVTSRGGPVHKSLNQRVKKPDSSPCAVCYRCRVTTGKCRATIGGNSVTTSGKANQSRNGTKIGSTAVRPTSQASRSGNLTTAVKGHSTCRTPPTNRSAATNAA